MLRHVPPHLNATLLLGVAQEELQEIPTRKHKLNDQMDVFSIPIFPKEANGKTVHLFKFQSYVQDNASPHPPKHVKLLV